MRGYLTNVVCQALTEKKAVSAAADKKKKRGALNQFTKDMSKHLREASYCNVCVCLSKADDPVAARDGRYNACNGAHA